MQTGNLIILNSYGRAPDSEEKYKGTTPTCSALTT